MDMGWKEEPKRGERRWKLHREDCKVSRMTRKSRSTRVHTQPVSYASTSHAPGLLAHHSGCRAIALIPLLLILYATSCSLGNAARTPSTSFLTFPSGSVAPVQYISAALAARGQTIGSRFSGEDCSVQRSDSPPKMSFCCSDVRFANGSKE